MGGRGFRNDVKGYLSSNRRTIEYKAVYKDEKLDILLDIRSPKAPSMPIFSNTAGKIYVLIGKKGDLKSIGFYDERHMLTKTIHLDHSDGPNKGAHVHLGDARSHVSGNSLPLNEEEIEIVKTATRIYEEWRKKENAQR